MATIEPTSTRRTVLPGAPPFTVDDLLKFPDDGNRYELFNGSLVVSPAPKPRHQRVISRLVVILETAAPAGIECLTTVNVSPSVEDLYIPDLVVVPEQVSEAVDLVYAPRDLLLAVEVVSPSSKAQDRSTKMTAYAEAGIPRYWRIEPDEGPSLYVYELDGRSYEGPTVHKAGAAVTLSAPFPVSFDPADLMRLRG
ncbi:Uma2 family endonuclease [Actinomadura sp. ATCC 31491]|uniref:Uma2 family endonuclease n=1 Tax=Actinomadura luzonensis TaxID=2805427 RepID=A0ABT0G7E9_9ACTN|nr:Uma2 family endonuclease [Actinomadura luzonensis]MCK2220524.1 Uma2 family endonuclease [Actinomadura luzonensis]